MARVEVHTLIKGLTDNNPTDIQIELEDGWWIKRYRDYTEWWNVFHLHGGVLCVSYFPYADNNINLCVSYKCCTQCGDRVPEHIMGLIEILRWKQ